MRGMFPTCRIVKEWRCRGGRYGRVGGGFGEVAAGVSGPGFGQRIRGTRGEGEWEQSDGK